MGGCVSYNASKSTATAKVILEDGRLQEYSFPVKASDVLRRDSDCFLCNSDEMEFDDVVTAVDDDDELQAGQIYFALPMSWLKRRLQPQEMAALAVKASTALVKSGFPSELVFAPAGEKTLRSETKKPAAGGVKKGRSTGGCGGRRNKVFTANLSVIAE